jgi:hypothetical protein
MSNNQEINASLTANYLLVQLSMKAWNTTKSDKNLAKKAALDNGAGDDSIAASRRIMTGADTELRALKSAQQAVRSYLYANSLPWSSATDGPLNGPRLVSVADSLSLIKELNVLQSDFRKALNDFKVVYTQRASEAMLRLGPLANSDDYPAEAELDQAFTVALDFSPVPTRQSFDNMALPAELATALGDRLAKRHSTQVDNAMRDLTERLTGYVENMAKTLTRHASGEKTRMYDSLIDNVRCTAALLKSSNLTDDPRLTSIGKALDELTQLDTKQLKNSMGMSRDLAEKATKVVKVLSSELADDDFDAAINNVFM